MLTLLEIEEALPCHKNHILRGEETGTTSWAFSLQGGRASPPQSSCGGPNTSPLAGDPYVSWSSEGSLPRKMLPVFWSAYRGAAGLS